MSLFKSICSESLDNQRYWLAIDYARKHFKRGHRLLEVGSDDGAFAVGFSMIGYEVTALDPETTPSLAQLYRYKRMTLHSFALFKEPPFDIVHLGEVLEHAEKPDVMMEQACFACKGKLIVSVPDFQWKGHLRTYTMEQIVEFAEEYIKIEHVYEITHPKLDGTQTLVMGAPK